MKYIKQLFYLLTLVMLLFSTLLPVGAEALINGSPVAPPLSPLSSNIGEALEIAPPLIYLNANPGQSVVTQIQVRDISKGPLLVSGQADDFIAAGTNGDPKILFHSTPKTDPFSMKSWVVPLANVVLQPEQTHNIAVTINVPKNASPGGHYGVIRFSATPPTVAGKSGVALSASLGTLILMTVSGHLVQNLSLNKFYVGKNITSGGSFFQSDPLIFSESLRNNGNIALQPSGTVTVSDMFNHQLVSMNINPQIDNILPDSTRIFSQDLIPSIIGKKQLFGRYSAKLNLTYGSNNQTINASLTFWVIPVVPILLIVAVLIIGFFLLRWLIKRYNQYILDKAKKARSK